MDRDGIRLLTSRQVSDRLGTAPKTISNVASRHGIGTLVTNRTRLYTEADVERLRQYLRGKVGRPKAAG